MAESVQMQFLCQFALHMCCTDVLHDRICQTHVYERHEIEVSLVMEYARSVPWV